MDTITITPFKEGMDMEKTKKELIEMGEEGYYTAILREYERFNEQ